MPVTCGTRLDRLRALARRVAHEIQVEEAVLALDVGYTYHGPIALPPADDDDGSAWTKADAAACMERLGGATHADVRGWACDAGLATRRGPLPHKALRAYEIAHTA